MNFYHFLVILAICAISVQSSSGEMSKRFKRQTLPAALTDFERLVVRTKSVCAKKLGVSVRNELLMSKPHHTEQEKCLLECILKRTGLMDPSTNRMNTRQIASIANMASENNALVTSIAVAMAENCNKRITTNNPCEAASQITQCVSKELRQHSIILNI